MRPTQVTFMAFILLNASWDGQAQTLNSQHAYPAESQKGPGEIITQAERALPEAPKPSPTTRDQLDASLAARGPHSLGSSLRVYTADSLPRELVSGYSSSSTGLPEAPQPQSGGQSALAQIPSSQDGASVSGEVLDPSGAAVVGAQVTLSNAAGSQPRTLRSGADGYFIFASLPTDSYFVSVRAVGFHIFTSDPVAVAPHKSYEMPKIMMAIATANTEVTVRPTEELAAEQVRAEEKQRVFGIIPAFFTSYVYDAAPLTARQKFSLTAHDTFDPVSFVGVGLEAGIQQANNTYPGYGQGAAAYGKRYAAALGNSLTSDFLGHAVFPSLLHQDPRYFYQGSGSTKSRFWHAVSFAVSTRSDSGHLMLNYSYLLGDLGSGALSNLYYPHADRGAGLVFTNAAISMGGRAAGSVFREFFSKRITTNVPDNRTP